MTAGSPRLLAADSFRVRVNPRTGDAEVRGLELHRRRFRTAVLDAHGTAAGGDRVDAFLAGALPRIAAYGEGFPRLELWEERDRDPELRLALRPLPELRDTIELRSAPGVRLEHPHRKGPNIARLAELNRGLGAEALLLDADGRALEGATTSLIWWRDDADQSGGAVDEPSTGGGRVASVTEELLHRTARGRLAAGRPTPAELTRCEVWAVNALHGIRVVTSIDGVALPESHGPRLERFREALDRTWAPLPTA